MTPPSRGPDTTDEPSDQQPRRSASSETTSAVTSNDIFLRNSSQALRTRFTTLKGFWQLFDRRLHRGVSSSEQDATAEPLREEFERFEDLLMQYLDARDLQWGRVLRHETAVDLAVLSRAALADIELRRLVAPRHRLVLDTPEHVVGHWDERWLRDALQHVIVNAVQYSPDGGEIHITINRVGDSAHVTVQDHGIGVDPDERELIFHPFYRGKRAQHAAPGLGLGLFIAGSVMALHGGSVEVESHPNDGSVFTLHLPLEAPNVAEPQA